MKTRYYALVMGIVFLAIGLLGFVPGLLIRPEGMELLTVDAGHGYLFGLFAVNIVHNLVHLAFGVWGVVVWRSFAASRVFARTTAIVYAVLLVMGLVPGLQTLFGLVPLHGNDVWLHAVIAIVAAYFGYAPAATVEQPGQAARRP